MFPVKEIIVVEGAHDRQKLESLFPGIDTIVTGGSSISDETLDLIQRAAESRGIILFLDPDFPGKQITNRILQHCQTGSVKMANIERSKAYSKNRKKIGVEHAEPEDLIQALDQIVSLDTESPASSITTFDLMQRKLVHHRNASALRNEISNKLHIPPLNGKSLLKFLRMMRISLSELDELMK